MKLGDLFLLRIRIASKVEPVNCDYFGVGVLNGNCFLNSRDAGDCPDNYTTCWKYQMKRTMEALKT